MVVLAEVVDKILLPSSQRKCHFHILMGAGLNREAGLLFPAYTISLGPILSAMQQRFKLRRSSHSVG